MTPRREPPPDANGRRQGDHRGGDGDAEDIGPSPGDRPTLGALRRERAREVIDPDPPQRERDRFAQIGASIICSDLDPWCVRLYLYLDLRQGGRSEMPQQYRGLSATGEALGWKRDTVATHADHLVDAGVVERVDEHNASGVPVTRLRIIHNPARLLWNDAATVGEPPKRSRSKRNRLGDLDERKAAETGRTPARDAGAAPDLDDDGEPSDEQPSTPARDTGAAPVTRAREAAAAAPATRAGRARDTGAAPEPNSSQRSPTPARDTGGGRRSSPLRSDRPSEAKGGSERSERSDETRNAREGAPCAAAGCSRLATDRRVAFESGRRVDVSVCGEHLPSLLGSIPSSSPLLTWPVGEPVDEPTVALASAFTDRGER